MPGPVVNAVETILNKLTDGLHETTRLNKRPIRHVEPDPIEMLSLRDKGVKIDFLDAYHPESEPLKTAAFIDSTLDEAAKLILKMNEGTFFSISGTFDNFYWILYSTDW